MYMKYLNTQGTYDISMCVTNKPTTLSQSVFFCTPIAFLLFHSTFSNNALIQRNMDNFLFPQQFV